MITIKRNSKILAHHTTESPLSHYGQPVWVIEDPDPDPGPITYINGDHKVDIDLLAIKGGWAIVRPPEEGFLEAIIWSDGLYYADMLVDKNGQPVESLPCPGMRVRGTVVIDPSDPDDIGAILRV